MLVAVPRVRDVGGKLSTASNRWGARHDRPSTRQILIECDACDSVFEPSAEGLSGPAAADWAADPRNGNVFGLFVEEGFEGRGIGRAPTQTSAARSTVVGSGRSKIKLPSSSPVTCHPASSLQACVRCPRRGKAKGDSTQRRRSRDIGLLAISSCKSVPISSPQGHDVGKSRVGAGEVIQ
jgi:hypothetical protein